MKDLFDRIKCHDCIGSTQMGITGEATDIMELLELAEIGQQSQDRERVLQSKIDELEYESLENLKLGNRALRHEQELHAETKDRERVLREALEEIHKITVVKSSLDMQGTRGIYLIAKEALEASK